MIRNIEIAILNKKYSLATDELEVVMDQAVDLLQAYLEKLTTHGTIATEKAAICVALQLATEIIKQQEEKQVVNEHVKRIITLCEQQ